MSTRLILTLIFVCFIGNRGVDGKTHHCCHTPTPIIRVPHGLFEIGGNPLVNHGFNGDRQTISWSQSETADGIYNWKGIDAAIAAAAAAHKQLGTSVNCLSQYPVWLVAAGAKEYTNPGKGLMILPFDPAVQPKLLEFIKQLCLHLDGKVDYITMGGFGYKTESYMPLPADIGYPATATDFISAWVNSANLQIDTHAQNLKQTPFILAAGTPFNDPTAVPQLTSVINHGLIYPLFSVMQWGLNARSATDFYINKFVSISPYGGFQMTGSETEPHVGGVLNGTLEDCLNAAVGCKAKWVEVYAQDGENPALQSVLVNYNNLIK